MKVFVIIVTYKGKRWYDKCFASLRKSTLPVEIVVVDNTPGNEDAEYIRTNHPDVHLIKTEENLGFGRANNLGMSYARESGCDFVFLLNQDTWIEEDAIDKLVKIAEKHPEYGIISPMHISPDYKHLNFHIGIGSDYRNDELLSDLYCNTMGEIYDSNLIPAAAWLLPRKTLETIGGFCPIIFHCGEDDDYCRRVMYHGMKIGLCPSSRIIHDLTVRVGNSDEYSAKAARDGLDLFLDYRTIPSLRSYRFYLLRNRFKNWLRGNKSAYDRSTHRYHILSQNWDQLNECRAANQIKQANWL